VSVDERAADQRAATASLVAGYTYGTIIVLSVIVAGAKAYPGSAGRIAVLVGATAVVFWLAHVYADGLGHSVAHDRRLTMRELGGIARREAAIVEAAVLPLAALLLGALDVLATKTSLWLAFGLGLAMLFAQALRYARMERLDLLATLLILAANIGLGLVLIALKLLVAH